MSLLRHACRLWKWMFLSSWGHYPLDIYMGCTVPTECDSNGWMWKWNHTLGTWITSHCKKNIYHQMLSTCLFHKMANMTGKRQTHDFQICKFTPNLVQNSQNSYHIHRQLIISIQSKFPLKLQNLLMVCIFRLQLKWNEERPLCFNVLFINVIELRLV